MENSYLAGLPTPRVLLPCHGGREGLIDTVVKIKLRLVRPPTTSQSQGGAQAEESLGV